MFADNTFAPQFSQNIYEFFLNPAKKRTIKSIKAIDEDENKCLEDECPCATLNYVIKSGNDATLFVINGTNGDLTFLPENGFTSSEVFLTIAAFNPFDSSVEGSAEVVIIFEEHGGMFPLVGEDQHATSRRLLQDQETVVPGFGRDTAAQDPEMPKTRHKRAVVRINLHCIVVFRFSGIDESVSKGDKWCLPVFMRHINTQLKRKFSS
jgi:hypothetical protein